MNPCPFCGLSHSYQVVRREQCESGLDKQAIHSLEQDMAGLSAWCTALELKVSDLTRRLADLERWGVRAK